MKDLVTYDFDGEICTIRMDDGRVNALSPDMLNALNGALDRAEQDGGPVLVLGRDGTFCAGFDLKVMRAGGMAALNLVLDGFRLAVRMLEHPRPIVVGCAGHAMAMGCFLLLASDERVGPRGDYKVAANEVRIGMTLPHAALKLCQMRLSAPHLQRATVMAHTHTPEEALHAGFFDVLADQAEVEETARALAVRSGELDATAHRETKLRLRAGAIAEMRLAIQRDRVDLVVVGVKALAKRKS